MQGLRWRLLLLILSLINIVLLVKLSLVSASKRIGGSLLFGVGWGLAGYCPGPAMASVISGGIDALVFVAALLVGLLIAKRLKV